MRRITWGNWTLDPPKGILSHSKIPQGAYDIHLDEIPDATTCLDWIFQVTQKTWVKGKDAADFIEALRDTIDPQANLCSMGIVKGRMTVESSRGKGGE
jgi:hypothetical protein